MPMDECKHIPCNTVLRKYSSVGSSRSWFVSAPEESLDNNTDIANIMKNEDISDEQENQYTVLVSNLRLEMGPMSRSIIND